MGGWLKYWISRLLKGFALAKSINLDCKLKEENKVNKADLISKMAEKSNLTKKDTEIALKAFIESVEEALSQGEKVQLVGFGTFETRERAARDGRNPKTKEPIKIAATVVPVFKAGKEFKEKVSK